MDIDLFCSSKVTASGFESCRWFPMLLPLGLWHALQWQFVRFCHALLLHNSPLQLSMSGVRKKHEWGNKIWFRAA